MPQLNSSPQLLSARLLTRHRVNTSTGARLRYFVSTPNGPAVLDVMDADYLCFCHQQDEAFFAASGLPRRTNALPLISFSKEPVSALYIAEYSSLRSLIRMAADAGKPLFETDTKPQDRYLAERFIQLDFEAQVLPLGQLGCVPHYQLLKARPADLAMPLRAVSFDVECARDGTLYSAAFYSDCQRTVLMVAPGGDNTSESGAEIKAQDGRIMAGEVSYYPDEAALLEGIITWFAQYDPDIILGWAVVSFDLALLWRRAARYDMSLPLGRGGQLLGWKVKDTFRPETLDLPGRVVLDGIDWLKAAFYQFDSYALDAVALALLGQGKAIEQLDNRGQEITQLFYQDKAALAYYNLMDCRLVWDIFQKTALQSFALARAGMTGLALGRVGASVAAFMHLYTPKLHRAGMVAPAPSVLAEESPGGYVMDSLPGLYRNIVVLDFKSLYPSIIRTFLIDPKGLITGLGLPQEETVAGFKGARFSRDEPILPGLIATLAQRREQAKALQDASLSQAIKILMNSLYGVLGSASCVFHDARLASSITMRGHEIMKQTRQWLEQEGYLVIYGDTDSTFIHVAKPPQDIAALGRQLAEMINWRWQQKLQQEYQLTSFLELEFECHYRQFFMPTLKGSALGSKKRYVGLKATDDKDELIFKGMEQVRSDWSPLAKQVQHELFTRLFAEQDIAGYLQQVLSDLYDGKLDQLLIFSKKLRRPLADYSAKSAPHVKAAAIAAAKSGDDAWLRRGARIEYIMTLSGAEPVQFTSAPPDYDYYAQKQLQSIAEPILNVLSLNYHTISSSQLKLI